MRIERKYMAHFIRTAEMEKFVRLGKDLEEYSPEISATVDSHRNILGQKRIAITGYDKSVSVEPYYAEKEDPLFAHLQDVLDRDAVMEELKVEVLDVKLWEEYTVDTYFANLEDAYLEITSYGGDVNGYRIGFKLHFTGVKKRGTFNVVDHVFEELGE